MDMDVFLVLGEVPLKLRRKNHHQSKQQSKFFTLLSWGDYWFWILISESSLS